MTRRRLLFVSGSRAEYGIQRRLLKLISSDPDLDLQMVVTGSHLSVSHGLTIREIETDGIPIALTVDLCQEGDTSDDIAKAIGRGVVGFADAIQRLSPELVVVFGDRFEMLCPAIASLAAGLPIAHIAGGQLSEGTMDDAIRHSLTKMAHLHFTSTDVYGKRIVQLGEDPSRVFVVGSLGLDAITREKLLERKLFEERMGVRVNNPALMITFHPATLDSPHPKKQIEELFAALDERPNIQLFFTMPNMDPGNNTIRELITAYVEKWPERASVHESLGRELYLSALSLFDGVVGNSSSGLIEAPSFHIGTVNIGDRQRGRIRPESVVDCVPERGAIGAAIDRILSQEFRDSIRNLINPFGDGYASERILEVLRNYPLEGLTRKMFYDIDFDLERVST